jgi:hypothetical protein
MHKNTFVIISVIALQLLVAGSLQAQKIANYDKKISQADKDIKNYLVPLIHGKWDYFARYGVKISSDSDILNLKFIPIKIYNMDSISIFSFDSNSTQERLLVLDTNRAVFYGIKDNKPVLAVFSEYRRDQSGQGQWVNFRGYGAIFPKLAEKVWDIINNKGTVFEIDIYAYPSNTGGYSQTYVVFNNGRQLMSILPDGTIQPLKEELLQLRLDLIQGDKMDKEMRRNKEKQKANP